EGIPCRVGGYPGRLSRQRAVSVQVIGCVDRASKRPFAFVAPHSAHKHSSFHSLMGVSASHHEDSDRRFTFDAVLHAKQPPIEPSPAKFVHVNCGRRTELCDTRVALGLTSMRPWTYDEALQASLCLR